MSTRTMNARVGDKVQLVVASAKYGMGEVECGDIGEVVSVNRVGELTINFPSHSHWTGLQKEVIKVTATENQNLEMRLAQVEKRVSMLQKAIEQYEVELREERAKKPGISGRVGPGTTIRYTPPTINEERAQAIAFAKSFRDTRVRNLERAGKKVYFYTNRKKGVVTAVINYYGSTVARGMAKLTPGDVFNEHIGQAIALSRCAGESIPKTLIHAPTPLIAVKGMLVDTKCHYGVMRLAENTDTTREISDLSISLYRTLRDCTIVDDTGALY